MTTRVESDTMGTIEVPEAALWGAQTERSRRFFAIGHDTMPLPIVLALVLIKKCAAKVNEHLGQLDSKLAQAISHAADRILQGEHQTAFPLSVWQTGSGTQTNMNVNEVLANLANQAFDQPLGSKKPVHPNDHVNMSQSSNDVFPTAMHVAAAKMLHEELLPSVRHLQDSIARKQQEFAGIVKIGRTHLQDATPMTLGQEFSGYRAQLEIGYQACLQSSTFLWPLAQGGTAVGTGLNSPPQFGTAIAQAIATETGLPFTSADNKFAALAGHEPLVHLSGCLKTLATALHKMANDIRWLASGPRCGIGELAIPENEPGSSIMPGKVNPTQAEALTMVCIQTIANDTAITMAGACGNFELNVYKPLIAHNILHSMRLLTDACTSFRNHCLEGITANQGRIAAHLHQSLMLITALTPTIGYDMAAKVAKTAHQQQLTLKEAALQLGVIDANTFDTLVRPEKMV